MPNYYQIMTATCILCIFVVEDDYANINVIIIKIPNIMYFVTWLYAPCR